MKAKFHSLSIVSLVTFVFFLSVYASTPARQNQATAESGAKNDKKLQRVRIGWIYSMANVPVIVANKKHYFEEQGLKVELKTYTSGPPIKKDMTEGNIDIAYMGVPAVYRWYPNGVKTKIIAKVNYGQAAVIAHKDSDINSLADLRGKKFAGVRIYSGMDVLLRGIVLKDNAKFDPDKDVDIVTTLPAKMGEVIEQKKVAAAFSWEPFTSQYLLRGKTKVIFDMNKEYPGYPWYVIMASPDAIKNKRGILIKVLKAHLKAVKFLNSSDNAGDDIIIKTFGLDSGKNSADKSYSAEKVVAQARLRLGWQARWARRDTRFMQKMMDHAFKLGYIKKKVNVKDIVDVSLLYEAMIN